MENRSNLILPSSKRILVILSCFLFSSVAYAKDFEIKVPIYLDGVTYKDTDSEYLVYKLKGSHAPIKVKPNYQSRIKSVKSFMSNLFYLYKNDRKRDFLKQFEPATRAAIKKIPKKEFQET